jgi:hypothetical protein
MELKDLRDIEAEKLRLEIDSLNKKKKPLYKKLEFYRHLTPMVLAIVGFTYLYYNGNFDNQNTYLENKRFDLERDIEKAEKTKDSIEQRIKIYRDSLDTLRAFITEKEKSFQNTVDKYDLLLKQYNVSDAKTKATITRLRNELSKSISHRLDVHGIFEYDLYAVYNETLPDEFENFPQIPYNKNFPIDSVYRMDYKVPITIQACELYYLLGLNDIELYERNDLYQSTRLKKGTVISIKVKNYSN